jgi:hypothetical protein
MTSCGPRLFDRYRVGTRAYIFKGKQYQRIDVANNGTVDLGNPLNIVGNWVGFTF